MNGTTVRRSPGRKGTPQAEPKSKLPRSVAEVLKDHVELEIECIDRMYLNVFVPRLQIIEGALRFIRQQLHSKVLSTTAVEPMTRVNDVGSPGPLGAYGGRDASCTFDTCLGAPDSWADLF